MKQFSRLKKQVISVVLSLTMLIGSFYIGGNEAQAAETTMGLNLKTNQDLHATDKWLNLNTSTTVPSYSDGNINGYMFIDDEFVTNYVTFSGGLTKANFMNGMIRSYVATSTIVQFGWKTRTAPFPVNSSFTIAKGAKLPYNDTNGTVSYVVLDAYYTFCFGLPSNTASLNSVTVTKSDTLPSVKQYTTSTYHYNNGYTGSYTTGIHSVTGGFVFPYDTDTTIGTDSWSQSNLYGAIKINGVLTKTTLTKSGPNLLAASISATGSVYEGATEVEIPAGSIFRSPDGSVELTITNYCVVKYNSTTSRWEAETKNVDTEIVWNRTALVANAPVFKYENTDEISVFIDPTANTTAYNASRFTGNVYYNDDTTPVSADWTKSGANFMLSSLTGVTDSQGAAITKVTVKAGTVLSNKLGGTRLNTITITNDLTISQWSDGTWNEGIEKTTYSTSISHYVGGSYVNGLHNSLGCFVFPYVATLFDENEWYFGADGSFTDATGTLANGPDGESGTYDDGLPATYDDFFLLLDEIAADNVIPVQWGSSDYFTWLLAALAADYEGYDDTMSNFLFEGSQELVKLDTVDPDTLAHEIEKVKITPENGYELARQEGYLYALNFGQKLLQNSSYYDANVSLSSAYKASDTQLAFVRNAYEQNAKPIAMIIEGSWWENEAITAFQETYGTSATKHDNEMEMKLMPFPKATKDQVGSENIQMSPLDSYCFINANIAEEKAEVMSLRMNVHRA